MYQRKVATLVKITGGELFNCDENKNVGIFVNNDKEVVENCVYLAFDGENHKGIDFAESAVSRGAALIIADKMSEKALPLLLVPDVGKALLEIAAYYRRKEIKTAIAVTGSVGKTTTKELCASVLSMKLSVHKTEGNKNNLIGLPLTVLSNTASDVAVLEAGISEIGEMQMLSRVSLPDIAIITGIGSMHSESLGNRISIASEKKKILSYAKNNAILIIPENEPLLRNTLARRVIKVGLESVTADLSAHNVIYTENGSVFDVRKRHQPYLSSVFVPILGPHGVLDALFAIAVGELFGVGERALRRGLAQYKAVGNRQNIIEKNGVVVMADCYNFGPESARAALFAFKTVAHRKNVKKTVIMLSDMLELGEISESEHIALGKEIGTGGYDALITVGEQAKNIALGALARGMSDSSVYIFGENERGAAGEKLKELAESGSAVLVKGSRRMKMEEFLPYIGT